MADPMAAFPPCVRGNRSFAQQVLHALAHREDPVLPCASRLRRAGEALRG